MQANINVEQALKTAVQNEGDDAADVVFNKKDDAQLVIYVMVSISSTYMQKAMMSNIFRIYLEYKQKCVKMLQLGCQNYKFPMLLF